jgi:hypothetical protein
VGYAGKVIFGVRMDEAVTKHPTRLVELAEEEVSGMLRNQTIRIDVRRVTCDSRRAPSPGKGFRE